MRTFRYTHLSNKPNLLIFGFGLIFLMMLSYPVSADEYDIPPLQWGEQGAREHMIETANRWHAYDNTPLPPSDLATHGPTVPAFPGAEGFGAYSFGGRGGELYRVTNLNDSGPGSFREAATAEGPRIIIFDVSGTIELESPLRIFHPYVTIAGQTAPGDGITIANRQVDIRTYDVILRHVRFRHGEGDQYHGDEWMLRTRGGNHVIMDHVTVTWGVDGNLGVTFVDNVTVQNSMLAKPLWNSLHPDSTRGYGALVRGRNGAKYSFLRNLWANHRTRVPRPGNYIGPDQDPDGVFMDFRNNVIYMGDGGNYDNESVTKYNIVNNYLLTNWYLDENSTGSQGYVNGNVLIDEIPEDEWRTILRTSFFVDREYHEQLEPFDPGTVNTLSAQEAWEHVIAHAGTHIRDIHDSLVVQEVINYHRSEIEGLDSLSLYDLPDWWQEQSIDHEQEVGGLPELATVTVPKWIDTNRNGIPDWWEQERGLDSGDPAIANMDSNGNGYTNLEEYINDLDAIRKTHELVPISSFVQAESASTQDGFDDFFRVVDDDEFDFSYIQATADAPDRDTAPDDGLLRYHTDLEGDVYIWMLVHMAAPDSNSFFIGFGDDELESWSFDYSGHEEDYGTWVWARYGSGPDTNESHTAGGDDSLIVARRDAGASLDRILFTKDPDYVPADPVRKLEIPTSVADDQFADVPARTELHQNYPNPFNPVTNITYSLHEYQQVRIEVYNTIGQRVAVLVDSRQPAGTHTVQFGNRQLSSGVYLYRMQTDQMTETRKMMFIK